MHGSGDEAFDEFQVEFLAYLARRLDVECAVATAMLSHWLVHHPHRAGSGSSKTLPGHEPASDQALR